jgi:hypothetical protein
VGKPDSALFCDFADFALFQDPRFTSRAGEALLSSILFERFERSGTTFTSISSPISSLSYGGDILYPRARGVVFLAWC